MLDTVAAEYELTREILSNAPCRRSNAALIDARHVAAYLLHRILWVSQPMSARLLGYKDHTTIGYCVKRTRELMEADARYAEALNALESTIRASLEGIAA